MSATRRGKATKAQPKKAAGKPSGKPSTLVTTALLRRWALPSLDGAEGKEERGQVMVVGGSERIPGAVVLAAIGALRAGAGKLQIGTARGVAPHVAVTVPEACVFPMPSGKKGELTGSGWRVFADQLARCQSLLVGPGMGDPAAGIALVEHGVKTQIKATLVLDAAVLEMFEGGKRLSRPHRGGVVLTPHAGEMAKLWGIDKKEVMADPLGVARHTAAALGAVVVMKGECTFIAAPDGTAYHNTSGNLGLGTSGSGDTLSGVIAGLCARGADAMQAAVWGVHLHGCAGDILARAMGPLGYLARELLSEIPPLLAHLTNPGATGQTGGRVRQRPDGAQHRKTARDRGRTLTVG